MLPVQKYRQTKNQGLLEFLKNNQVCAIKKVSKKHGGTTIKKKRYKKKQIIISGTCNHKAKIELKKMNAINFLLIWDRVKRKYHCPKYSHANDNRLYMARRK